MNLFKFSVSSLVALATSFFSLTSNADEYRPAYLELKQTGIGTFDMLWKVPARGSNQRLALYVSFADDVETVIPARKSQSGNVYFERSSIRRKDGLAGTEIRIDGLAMLPTEVLVRIERLDGSTEVERLNNTRTNFMVKGSPETLAVVRAYLVFGIVHILQGFDHLLFVACLIFIAGSWRRILVTITGFTLAHSITLTLAALDLVRLPVPPIEAAIALSIVFLAREIALERRDTLTWRFPIAVSASFGLLHGFGFASALSELGLPQTEIPAALLAFNVGVEIGQVAFVSVIIMFVWIFNLMLKKLNIHGRLFLSKIESTTAYGVGAVAMLWTIERVAGFTI
jgi:hydrogenase/urease accessory protein HupE